jgi:hypothetical protein
VQLPRHLQCIGQCRKFAAQHVIGCDPFFHRKMHTHEKQFGLLIAELRGMDDVATVVGQKAGHALHDAALIDAGQIEYVFWMHDDGLMAKRPDVGRRRVLSHGLPSTLKPRAATNVM